MSTFSDVLANAQAASTTAAAVMETSQAALDKATAEKAAADQLIAECANISAQSIQLFDQLAKPAQGVAE